MNVSNKAIEFFRLMGIEKSATQLYNKFSPPIYQGTIDSLENIEFPDISDINCDDTDTVVFFPEFYSRNFRTVLHGLFAHGLVEYDAQPIFLFGDGSFDACMGDRSDYDDRCVSCVRRSEILIDMMNLPAIFMDEVDIADIEYDLPMDVIKNAARSTTIRQLKRGELHDSDTKQQQIFDDYVTTGERAWKQTKNIDEKFDIDRIVTTGAPYSPRRIVLEYAYLNDIPLLCSTDPAYGADNNSLLFGKMDGPLAQYMSQGSWEEWKQRELTKEQTEAVETYMSNRFSGDKNEYIQYSTASEKIDPKQNTVISAFTHLPWDAAIADVNRVFDNQYEWIISLINEVKEYDNIHLYVKTHPAESIRGTDQTFIDVISEKNITIPNSVTILEAETDISPYELIQVSDSVFVYTSTTGMEAAYLGKPVVTVADAHYSAKGFTRDPENVAEFKKALKAVVNRNIAEPNTDLVSKYLYVYFMARPTEFEFASFEGETNNFRIEGVDSTSELITDEHSEFKSLIESIINDTEYCYTKGY